ncbi:MAG: MFS transporter [Cyanobacteria bacterium QH_1_48_107]|nr:MAG: MFS transporter [Cyanobacteria bacterium QH_1_48_107]
MNDHSDQNQLRTTTRVAYGVGDLGPAMAGNFLLVFCFFFLTNVAGLPPDQAGVILMLSNFCCAVSTLVVGFLSDRTQTRWGRRRVWMLGTTPIFAIACCLHWWVPTSDDGVNFAYYLIVALLFQAASTGYLVPYGALLTDLSEDYHERTRLTSYRFIGALGGGAGILLLARFIADWVGSAQQQFLDLGLVCALSIVISIVWCCLVTYEPSTSSENSSADKESSNAFRDFWREMKPLLSNRPLLFLIGIYGLSWTAVELLPGILPYFVVNTMDLDFSAVALMVLILQASAMMGMFLWNPLTQQVGKKTVFGVGTLVWILAEVGLFRLHAGDLSFMYGLATIAGLGMATAYLVPTSMLPEVADWDELQTGKRREGLFYSLMLFGQKMGLALGLFLLGQFLSWSGFRETVPGDDLVTLQPDSALFAVRIAMLVLPILPLLASLVLTYFYPLNQQVHQDTVTQLQQRRKGANAEYEDADAQLQQQEAG